MRAKNIFALTPLVIFSMAVPGHSWEMMFDSIHHTFNRGLEPHVIISLALVSLAGIAFVVINEIRRSDARLRARAKVGWDNFFTHVSEMRLLPAEAKQLESLVAAAGLANADSVFHSALVFENVLDYHYGRKHGGVEALEQSEMTSIRSLRDKLGYAVLPVETPYTSSRQFKSMERILVEWPAAKKSGSSHILDVDERYWIIANPYESGLSEGDDLRVSLTRGGDAEYLIEAEVRKVTREQIWLRHSRNLTRKQLRNWVRVDVSLPARVRALVPDDGVLRPGEWMAGRILDLSGGGLSLRLPHKHEVNTRLLADFEIPGTPFKALELVVIRVSAPNGNDGMVQHSASFAALTKVQQEKIVQFVFERQRQEAQWR